MKTITVEPERAKNMHNIKCLWDEYPPDPPPVTLLGLWDLVVQKKNPKEGPAEHPQADGAKVYHESTLKNAFGKIFESVGVVAQAHSGQQCYQSA